MASPGVADFSTQTSRQVPDLSHHRDRAVLSPLGFGEQREDVLLELGIGTGAAGGQIDHDAAQHGVALHLPGFPAEGRSAGGGLLVGEPGGLVEIGAGAAGQQQNQ